MNFNCIILVNKLASIERSPYVKRLDAVERVCATEDTKDAFP